MLEHVNEKGLVLLGCGKMGSALLAGWLREGLLPGAVHVIEPHPSTWLSGTGVALNGTLPKGPAVVVLAVKPQMMGATLPDIAALGGGETVVLSIAAGTPIATFEEVFGAETPIVRAMPNTPAAVGAGITALVGNAVASGEDLDLASQLMRAVGEVVPLAAEAQMDAVTAVSGSGPAYVFHLIETLAAAGVAEGLPPDLSLQLARATIAGAGALAQQSDDDPGQLRVNVTSPGGTTQAALEVLMRDDDGLSALIKEAVQAAARRSRELADG